MDKIKILINDPIGLIGRKFKYYISPFFDWLNIKFRNQFIYNYTDMKKSLNNKNHDNCHVNDIDVLRIMNSFENAKQDQRVQSQPYQIGGVWEQILIESHKELRDSIKMKNINGFKSIISNFGRDKISNGLSLFGELPNSLYQKISLLNRMNKSHEIWKIITRLPDNYLEYPNGIGNLFGVKKNEKIILPSSFRSSYYC